MTKKRADCHVCGKNVQIRKNGTLWNHNDDNAPNPSHMPFGVRCDGSGKPAEETA